MMCFVSFTMVFQEGVRILPQLCRWTGRYSESTCPTRPNRKTIFKARDFFEVRTGSSITSRQNQQSGPHRVIHYGADDDVVYPTFKNISHMKIKGTRVALEAKVLDLKVYDKMSVLPGSKVLIGSGSLALLGASTGRSLTTRLCWKRPFSRGKRDADADNDGEVHELDHFATSRSYGKLRNRRGKTSRTPCYRPY